MNKVEQAVGKFSRGANCAQSVLLTYCNELDLDMSSLLKVGTGFGGGIRQGEVCGAVAGAIMVLGLKYGPDKIEDKESKEKVYEMVGIFNEKFKKMNSSITCRDLLGCNLNQKGMREYAREKGLFKDICPKLIKDAINILDEI
ncbi:MULTISPECIES: C-GCAxxG-C-C family protein [Clostridium]|jgi:C_GCAxxG_C_C family probable redox protein|uniref:C-GCAxxG-C-C family protein n=1 Tax=Clostridium TaxID=1485 RepID=UPI000289C131|nr:MULTISPECIES: C-GCAxxG-C-C family protein [Clostridium]MDF2503611.1 GCAxxG family probable redox protein [Clostridium sp.]